MLVVGDHATLKVHVHTDDPEQATLVFAGAGEVSRLDVADMHAQVVEREARLSAVGSNGNGNGAAAFSGGATTIADAEHQQTCGALAVATGAGLVALFEGLGARVLDGGPTLNPSTDGDPRRHPRRARRGGRRPARTAPTSSWPPSAPPSCRRRSSAWCRRARSRPALSAAFALNAERRRRPRTPTRCRQRWTRCAPVASRQPRARITHGRFAVGDAVGYVGEELVAWGNRAPTLEAVLGHLVG